VILALRYLGYLVALPPTHYARAALEDSFNLYELGGQGYWMDLVYALGKLPNPLVLPTLSTLTPESCTALGKAVYTPDWKSKPRNDGKSSEIIIWK
jgi:hypothetical protein